jgi:hypothetical protein
MLDDQAALEFGFKIPQKGRPYSPPINEEQGLRAAEVIMQDGSRGIVLKSTGTWRLWGSGQDGVVYEQGGIHKSAYITTLVYDVGGDDGCVMQ